MVIFIFFFSLTIFIIKNYSMEKLTKKEFINKARQIHGNKYDYSKVEYKGNKIKICIVCPIHGEFWQEPRTHLNGSGCPKCKKNFKLTTKTWIEKARQIHGDKYDYSKVEYINNKTKICIICPIHGEFWQNPNSHLQGFGCKKCGTYSSKNKQQLGYNKFVQKAKQIHDDKYDYSKVKYVNNATKICIVCPIHGEFWQTPSSHLNGKSGCPFCSSEQNMNENRLFDEIIHNINEDIIRWKKFKWLKNKHKMSLDIYIPSKKIAIEYQGDQHFKKIERDLNKIKLCEEHGVKLLHFTYHKNSCKNWDKYKVYTDINDLMNEINERDII